MCISAGIGHKFNMGDGPSGFHSVLPAHGSRVGPVWLPVDSVASLCVVFVNTTVVAVLHIKVKHWQTGSFNIEHVLRYFT